MIAPRNSVTTGKASLVGGVVVAIAVLVLWLAVTRELGLTGRPALIAGMALAAAAGVWTRLADL